MTQNTQMTLAQVETLVKNFDKNFKDTISAEIAANDVTIKGLHDKSADRTYDMIAALLDLANTLEVGDYVPSNGLRQFLLKRNLVPARGNNNPYLPFVKAVYSVETGGKWSFDNRAAEKYANVLRHLDTAKHAKTLNGTIQDYIRNYDDPTYGAKMRGIEAQDRADNPSKGAAATAKTLLEKGVNAPALAKIGNTFGITGRKVVVLYGQTNINGEVEVLEVKALKDEEADSFYRRLGRTL